MAALPDRTEDSIKSLIYKEKRKQAYTEERRAVRVSLLLELLQNWWFSWDLVEWDKLINKFPSVE